MDLSLNLRGIVAQRLIPDEEDGLHLAAEVLINTPYVTELIRKGQFGELKDIIAKGTSDGMQTFDQALYKLYTNGHVSKQVALEYAGSRNDLALADDGLPMPEHVFNRVFNGQDMPAMAFVAILDQRSHRGGFAGAGGANKQQ